MQIAVVIEDVEGAPPVEPPARPQRPILGKRQGAADRAIRLYARHELGTIIQIVWYPDRVSAFCLKSPSGSGPSPAAMAEVEEVGRILHKLATWRPVHYQTIRRVYFDGERGIPNAWRLALDAYATEAECWAQVDGPTNSL